MIKYNNNLIKLVMNININIRNKKIGKKLMWFTYKITCMPAANFPKL